MFRYVTYTRLIAGPVGSSGFCDGQCCDGTCEYNAANGTWFCCKPCRACRPNPKSQGHLHTFVWGCVRHLNPACNGRSGTNAGLTAAVHTEVEWVPMQVPQGPLVFAAASAAPVRLMCALITRRTPARAAVSPSVCTLMWAFDVQRPIILTRT